MADNSEDKSLEKFAPNTDGLKTTKSATKRVALFIFIASGALFMLVSLAIENFGGNTRSSSAPTDIVSPAAVPSVMLPPPVTRPAAQTPEPQQTQAQLEPEPEPEPEPEQTVTPSPVRVQPVYVPTPRGRTRARNVTELRKQAHALRLQAASAPSSVSGFPGSGSSTQAQPQVTGENTAPTAANPAINTPVDANADAMANLMQQNAAENDPNGWARKEAFLKQSLPAEYSQYTRTFPVSALELKAGSLFPCVLISGINSDLPGNIIAQVSENVYDTATGRYLLVPRGSRLIGTYDHQISTGQNRVLVVWSRLIFPDGSSLVLDNLQGADQSGFSGFKGTVNRHWNVMLTSALLVALIGAGVEAASPSNSGSVFSNSDKSVGAILRERTATAIADVLTQVIRKNINRQPTILIKPGYRFMIFAQHDIVFPRIWNERLGR